MKSGGKVLIQVLVVSLIGLASAVGVWLLLSQGASAGADISVSKTANPISLPAPGGTVTFTVRVTNNSGTDAVTLTLLTDDVYGNLDDNGTCALTQTILAEESYECFFTEAVSGSAGDYVDTVTAEAEDGEGNHDTASDSATVSITVGPLNYIQIEDEAGGTGNEVDTYEMTTDGEFIVYAAAYDAYDNYIADQVVDWATTDTLDSQTGNGSSFTFAPSTADTSGTITADAGGGMTDATGTITVNIGDLHHITICTDAGGQISATDHTMTTDDTWPLWAAGLDADDNFIANQTVTWGKIGDLDNVSGSGMSYTFSPATAGTSGTITAAHATAVDGETGTITVNVGVLHRIVIEDAADGTGNEVNTHSLVVGETFQVWAAGYDADDNYRSDVTVTWTGTDVVAGRLSPASGSSTTTFTAEEAGTGTIRANDGSGHEDETGLITVQTPVLTITKLDNPDPVNAGATLAYTIIITNSGDADGTAVIVTEHYDPNFTFWAASPLPDDYGTGNRTWTVDTLEVGASQTIIVWGNVASPLPVGTVLTNQITLDSDQTTPVTITEVTDVTTASELTVSKIDIPDPVPAGGNLTYIISYQNGGTAPAEDVVITEMYDSQVTYLSASPLPDLGNNVWYTDTLAVGEGGSIQVTVRVNTPLPDGTTLTNSVTIDSAHTSPQTYVETTGVSAPDLAVVAATHEPSIFSPGELMNYTVTYSNTGHREAENAIITTTLPPDTTYAGQDWTSSDGQTYTYEVGGLSAGAGGQACFPVRYADHTQIGAVEFNTPFIISESGIRGDANLDNNTAYVYIGVPDLVVTDFTFEPSPLHPGQPVTFTVVVKNQGTGVAWNPDNGSGFFVDVFTTSISSYPFERDGVHWKGVLGIGPGLQRTVVITHSGFKEEDIGEEIERFYVKVDNHSLYPYGLVPEYNEMNNIYNPSWSYYAYLPLVFR